MAVAVVAGYNAVGNREDLEDVIYKIYPEELPLQNIAAKETVTALSHEYQTQPLAVASPTVKAIDNGAIPTASSDLTSRLNNRIQHMPLTAAVGDQQEAVRKAGRSNELTYQVVLKGIELKRHVEAACVQNNALIVGTSGAASQMAGFESYINVNVSHGATGATTGWTATDTVATPTDGTTRAITIAILNSMAATVRSAGGRPKVLMCGPLAKVNFSALQGTTGSVVTQVTIPKDKEGALVTGADVWVSPFGLLTVLVNDYMRDMAATNGGPILLIDPEYVAIGTLQGITRKDLPKTTLGERAMVSCMKTVIVRHPNAHGKIADLKVT